MEGHAGTHHSPDEPAFSAIPTALTLHEVALRSYDDGGVGGGCGGGGSGSPRPAAQSRMRLNGTRAGISLASVGQVPVTGTAG